MARQQTTGPDAAAFLRRERSRAESSKATASHRRSKSLAARADAIRQQGLFPCEAEIARRLSQSPEEWAAKAKVLEREGLPRIDPVMNGRPWRAVVAFFDRRYGVDSMVPLHQPDGEENLNAL